MKVLLSIKPEYANKILSGDKHFEFRKAIFKNPDITTVVIYSTMPVGKVVGEFEIDEIIQDSPKSIWQITREFSGITKDFFDEYFLDRDKAFAIKVKNIIKYHIPKDLKMVKANGVAPQSFCYLRNFEETSILQ